MDNLAHSFVGAVVGCALAPSIAAKHRRRLMVASAAVANCPDLDILLLTLGRSVYVFHHRGFTHSLFGLTLMLPFAYWLFVTIMGKARLQEGTAPYAAQPWLFFVAVQLIFSHFFLDYLTSYGTLFLYPFSWQRFSFPLMFILDPVLWLLAGLGFLVLFYRDLGGARQIGRVAWGTLLAIGVWWGIELAAKRHTEGLYWQLSQGAQAAPLPADRELVSYPGPLAPIFWHLLEKRPPAGADAIYRQAAVSYWGQEGGFTWWQEPIPAPFRHGALCAELADNPLAQQEFQRFASWAEHYVCDPFTWEGQAGCRCLSLKYSLLALGGVAYGAYWISPQGEGVFLPGSDRRELIESYRRFLPLPL